MRQDAALSDGRPVHLIRHYDGRRGRPPQTAGQTLERGGRRIRTDVRGVPCALTADNPVVHGSGLRGDEYKMALVTESGR
jgi:hypothetical protein